MTTTTTTSKLAFERAPTLSDPRGAHWMCFTSSIPFYAWQVARLRELTS